MKFNIDETATYHMLNLLQEKYHAGSHEGDWSIEINLKHGLSQNRQMPNACGVELVEHTLA